jgi:ribonuclease P protein component
LGITTSRKSGESVQRSRIRRLIREAWRLHQDELPGGWDFVVIARKGADLLSLDQVTAALRHAIKRLLAPGPKRPPAAAPPQPQGSGGQP